jgi:hypothetical protein
MNVFLNCISYWDYPVSKQQENTSISPQLKYLPETILLTNNINTMTVLKKFKAIIYGNHFSVEQLYNGNQEIWYIINDGVTSHRLGSNAFWSLKPTLK